MKDIRFDMVVDSMHSHARMKDRKNVSAVIYGLIVYLKNIILFIDNIFCHEHFSYNLIEPIDRAFVEIWIRGKSLAKTDFDRNFKICFPYFNYK